MKKAGISPIGLRRAGAAAVGVAAAGAPSGPYENPIVDLFARLGGTGTWVDPLDGQTVFSDTAGTTQAVQGGMVARIDAAGGVQASFTNGTAPQRPLLRADGLEFDGVDDRLACPDDPALRFGLTDFTVAFACKPGTTGGSVEIWDKRGGGGPGTSPGWGLRRGGTSLDLVFDFVGATQFLYPLAAGVFSPDEVTYGLVQVDRNASTAMARVGGIDFPLTAIEAGDISGTRQLRVGLNFDGIIGRFLAIDKLLSPEDKTLVEQWLQNLI